MAVRKRFDFSSPGAAALRDKIVHGAFKTEGQMVAFLLSFPSVSIPIRGDESRITALDVSVIGRGPGDTLWRIEVEDGTLETDALSLPAGNWNCEMTWDGDPETGLLYTADGDANLNSLSDEDGFSGRDGEIVIGEDDDLGYLWLYFLRIKNTRT